jgi:hypothetical protein
MARAPEPLRLVIAIAVTAAVLLQVGYWLRGGRPAPMPRGTAQVAGVVTDSDGSPMPQTVVRLTARTEGRPSLEATSDAQGRFAFANVPAGQFSATVTRPGYALVIGDAVVRYGGVPVTVEDGQHVADVAIRLVRFGAITGTVYGAAGAPVKKGFVRVANTGRIDAMNGAGELHSIDAHGRFEAELPPGTYVVEASLGQALRDRVFHPSTWRRDEAAAIAVGAGQRVEGIDIRVPDSPVRVVRGVVSFARDDAHARAQVLLVSESTGSSEDRIVSTTTDQAGRFSFDAVPDDRYVVVAQADVPSSVKFWAREDVEVRGGDTTVALRLRPGGRISGRAAFAGDGTAPTRETTIALDPANRRTRVWPGVLRTRPAADGTFAIDGIPPGDYRLYALVPGWTVQRITIGETTLLHPRVSVAADQTIDQVQLTLAKRAADRQ